MTKQEFETLTNKGIILLDGATGSNLTLAGMPKGVSTELWVLEHPEVLQKLQESYVDAGSQIVYAPTFTANRVSMANFGMEKKIWKLNHQLVQLSRDAVGKRALIAGDLTTTGRLMEPKGEMSYDELFSVYKEQVEAIADAGADLLVFETMLSVEETTVALDAAQSVCDLPVMCSLSVEADGTALYGGNAMEAVETLQELGAAAVGVNCSMGPDQLESVIANMAGIARIPVIAKPNAGMPFINEKGEAIYDMDASRFAQCMKSLTEAGARIIGGCCGTTPEYIRAVRDMLI